MGHNTCSPEESEDSVRVLVVADRPMAAERLAGALRRQGISVATFVGSTDDDDIDSWAYRHRREDAVALVPFRALSVREQFVLGWLMEGLSADMIARRSWVSVSTVRSHIKSILRKLDVTSQLAAVALAYRVGWRPADLAAEA
ncbi:MAG: response regulator transcription factor [Acidimicrobiales bacterium]